MASHPDITALKARKQMPAREKKKVGQEKPKEGGEVKRRTLSFGEVDEQAIDRIETYLRDLGYSRVATAKIIRIALRVAFVEDLTGQKAQELVEDVLYEDGRRKL